jgi:hypothetical protein
VLPWFREKLMDEMLSWICLRRGFHEARDMGKYRQPSPSFLQPQNTAFRQKRRLEK